MTRNQQRLIPHQQCSISNWFKRSSTKQSVCYLFLDLFLFFDPSRLSRVGQEEGGPSWSSLQDGAGSSAEENALNVVETLYNDQITN